MMVMVVNGSRVPRLRDVPCKAQQTTARRVVRDAVPLDLRMGTRKRP